MYSEKSKLSLTTNNKYYARGLFFGKGQRNLGELGVTKESGAIFTPDSSFIGLLLSY